MFPLSNVFSTKCETFVGCPNPVLTIGFPTVGTPGPNTVVLANGAVVDLVELGRIISNTCPQFTCPAEVITVTAVAPTTTVAGLTTAQAQAQAQAQALAQLQAQAQVDGVQATMFQNGTQQLVDAAQASQNMMNAAAAAQLGFMRAFDLIDG